MNALKGSPDGYVIESLTRSEISKIRKMVSGYGNFKKTAEKVGLPVTTLRDILNKGYGIPYTIQQIRTSLFEAE